MKKISVSLSGHQTSITLEPEFIAELKKLSIRLNLPIAAIINQIDSTRSPNTNLSSAIRVWILQQALKK